MSEKNKFFVIFCACVCMELDESYFVISMLCSQIIPELKNQELAEKVLY